MNRMFDFTLVLAGFFLYPSAFGASLSLHDYLQQVDGKNQDIVADKENSEGSGLAVREADLLYSPAVFASTQWSEDYFTNSLFPTAYQSTFSDNYTLGVNELTPYGFNFSVSYLLSHQGYLGAADPSSGAIGDRRFYEGTPKFDITVSLLRNWLGDETKATEEVTRASNLVNQYSSSYQAKATRADAESAYIRLVSEQQLVKVYQDSLASSNDIYRWNEKRMKVNLGELSDLLEAQGNVESSTLLLQSSLDDLRVAARDFNRLRNIDSDTVEDVLELPAVETAQVPERSAIRDDVRAAQENARLAAAQSKLGEERNRPTLEAFGSVALNNRALDASQTFNGSFALGQQATSFGLRFNMPLAFGTLSDVVHGFKLQQDSSEKLVTQKIFEQEVDWKNLTQQLSEAKRRYEIATSLSKIQQRKVENERSRLKRGRTTTYQTLIFNIDFNTAEASRIQAQATVLNLIARMKTFGEDRL